MSSHPVTLEDIQRARKRIASEVHRTPVLTCSALDRRAGRALFFKCESFQKGGAFKARGATNAIAKLSEAAAARGVVTHSSGNHAQAVAIAARARGIEAHIVMPTDAPAVKRAAVTGYGATIHPCAPTLSARTETAARLVAQTGGTLIPPYDHPDIIAGQGTVALELLEQVPDLDAVVVPIGGGGLMSGCAIALNAIRPEILIVGAEPAGADDAYRSKVQGARVTEHRPNTIADGLRTTLGELTWPVIRDQVESIVRVDDLMIVAATKLLFERAKIVVEPSGATGLAAVLSRRFREIANARPAKRVGVVLTGGNVDLDGLPWVRPEPGRARE